uniref:S-formylglutathione hydrolase n=1 Tax=Albugo laibachii Nc14 TaxID=890382 RepID=F0W0I0_9STRA|nr:Sformylglutathione hydrolase putative [Albugo laibachii Nc14]|eukprot:CCA14552.1 Sformylglutathione hydrolase putative [Albugo laibachii Nc14]
MELLKRVKAHDGYIKRYCHESEMTKCKMTFSIFLPSVASDAHKVPLLYYLAGLTCNDELFFTKASVALKAASIRGIAIVCPDTSPRGVTIEGQNDDWDFGTAAGFYVDATEPNWKEHYRMHSYVVKELPSLLSRNFPVLEEKKSIMGHSMGGHGALTLALRNGFYASVSTFAPISHPMECPWGMKAFTGYLGCDLEKWKEYDATYLMLQKGPIPQEILIDQGTEDSFYLDKQLLPEAFEAACKSVHQEMTIRFHDGYDHSYFFISTFVEEHINFHADALLA